MIGCGLTIPPDLYDSLGMADDTDKFQKKLGFKLTLLKKNPKFCRVFREEKIDNVKDIFKWHLESLRKFIEVFKPYIKELDEIFELTP
jgi:hypothetical protein